MSPCKTLISKLLLCFVFYTTSTVNARAQPCSGSWALQRPLTIQCVTGQWIGWQNSTNPSGCPTNPIYSGTQVNTFTFTNPVSTFSIDFKGLDGPPGCPRIEIKINDIFYPLTSENLSDFPTGSSCVTGSFSYVTASVDGYITVSLLGNSSLSGHGRITISNINANSITISSNDINGTVFSDPFNCTTVPLVLESFTGNNLSSCNINLNWKTGIEINVRNIEIQRSSDGTLFNKIGEVSPKGSNSLYSFTSDSYTEAYYRLKIIDLDGSYDYSETLFIRSSCNKNYYSLTPNPASFYVEISGLKSSDNVLIFDMTGRLIKIFKSPIHQKPDISFLPSGTYILEVISKDMHRTSLRLIKLT